MRILVLTIPMQVAHRLILVAVGITPLVFLLLALNTLQGPALALAAAPVLVAGIFMFLGILAADSHVWGFTVRRPRRVYPCRPIEVVPYGPTALRVLMDLSPGTVSSRDDASRGTSPIAPGPTSPILVRGPYPRIFQALALVGYRPSPSEED